ncbi:hypothetical protein CRENBAI_018434 [Crenichthys baileyi]|uniref:Uncharacterized protein n=1 Tax=Crenichthys baileyi TaxID=28760 RepID=A0AAV9SQR3_9TELE
MPFSPDATISYQSSSSWVGGSVGGVRGPASVFRASRAPPQIFRAPLWVQPASTPFSRAPPRVLHPARPASCSFIAGLLDSISVVNSHCGLNLLAVHLNSVPARDDLPAVYLNYFVLFSVPSSKPFHQLHSSCIGVLP